tara:strand:+ start:98 stop:919 length:822 start_codon:yes stop_codon:yes gene_type:complete
MASMQDALMTHTGRKPQGLQFAQDTLQSIKDAPGNILKWAQQNPVEASFVGASTLPVVGDAIGFGKDVYDMSPMGDTPFTATNTALAGAGLLPFVPAGMGSIKKAVSPVEKRQLADYGKKLLRTGDRKFEVVDGRGTTSAEIWMREDMGGIADIRVKEYMRGKGLANSAMDEIEKTTGIPLKVTDNLSEQGFNMWRRRDPAQVSGSLYHHKDSLLGKTASDGRVSGPIVEVRNEYVSMQPRKGITLPVRKDQLVEQGLIKRNGTDMSQALGGK